MRPSQLLTCAPLFPLLMALSLAPAPSPGATQAAADDEQPPGSAVVESTSCARCHSNAPGATAMRAPDGSGLAPFDLWQGTMMANASRDPLWRAAVAAEVAGTPAAAEEIQRTCLSCHAPMGHHVGLHPAEGQAPMDLLHADTRTADMARDGVSCTICHGITPTGLGTPASYTGGYELDPWRRLFGPHAEPFTMPMRRMTGFTPTHGAQILESAHCGSCHTLETEALAPDGTGLGQVLLEQAPYLEWRNSSFSTEVDEPGPEAASCQDCHLSTVDADGGELRTRIARNPGGRDFPPISPRAPFGSHLIVGGNTMVLELLRDHGPELGATAPPEAFEAALAATRAQLSERSARVAVEGLRAEDGRLVFDVAVENLTGHKLPTAHPSRRAWLRVVVRAADGRVLFASGDYDERGRILGADGQPLASEAQGGPVQPHRDQVRSADEVALYRAVLADAEGNPTHLLLRGASYLTDDRLLPRGWRADGPDAERTAPVGFEDPNFRDGGDRVTYRLPVTVAEVGTLEVQLLHQSYSARWAAELFRWEAPDIARFAELYAQADPRPNVMGRVTYALRPAQPGGDD